MKKNICKLFSLSTWSTSKIVGFHTHAHINVHIFRFEKFLRWWKGVVSNLKANDAPYSQQESLILHYMNNKQLFSWNTKQISQFLIVYGLFMLLRVLRSDTQIWSVKTITNQSASSRNYLLYNNKWAIKNKLHIFFYSNVAQYTILLKITN